ncbi:MAG: hypothetical protein RLZZ241_1056 [Bacteroidota bacterium]|jgi:histidinol dehydrogenase
MKLINYPGISQWDALLRRPELEGADLENLLHEIFNAVKVNGDAAVLKYSEKFDRNSPTSVVLSPNEIKARALEVELDLKEAIDLAYANIFAFHKAQFVDNVCLETVPGVTCWQEKKPITRVGIYIPGGSAPLFSTVLMLAIPAQIAKCKEVILCSPADENGSLHPAICYAALKCGVSLVCPVGGIQAIAALTHGTESIPSVYKIFGPGNQYVTKAKQYAVRFNIAIDMPAGPSEVMVVADQTADPKFVAADLLSQAEHGPDSQVILISDDSNLLEAVQLELRQQILDLPRSTIAAQALAHSLLILLRDEEELMKLVNHYGPEHLIICHNKESYLLEHLQQAGSVFLGNYTPESAGDYASGTNHTLPTNGYSKQYSGVNLDSFMKTITFQRITREGLNRIGPAIEIMARAEGLEAHARAVTLRLKTT